jgi:hypothetical protein
MQDHTRPHVARAHAAMAAAAAFVLILLTPSALDAQSIREREAKRQEMQQRLWTLRNLDRLKDAPPEKQPDMRPVYDVVEQDFEQLQLVNHSLAVASQQGAALDYELIKKHSGEVRKRASRLKSYLVLPDWRQTAPPLRIVETQTPEALRSAVASLDALVNDFAWNPIFKQPNVVNLEQSAKAARDLEGVISLSERINKSAAEMSKLAKKSAKK